MQTAYQKRPRLLECSQSIKAGSREGERSSSARGRLEVRWPRRLLSPGSIRQHGATDACPSRTRISRTERRAPMAGPHRRFTSLPSLTCRRPRALTRRTSGQSLPRPDAWTGWTRFASRQQPGLGLLAVVRSPPAQALALLLASQDTRAPPRLTLQPQVLPPSFLLLPLHFLVTRTEWLRWREASWRAAPCLAPVDSCC